VSETGSAWVNTLFDPALNNEVFISAITPVEITAAITRRARGGTMTAADAAAISNLFCADLRTSYQVVSLTDVLIARAMTVAETYGLRGYDAVQLATALEINVLLAGSGLPPLTFVSADRDLNAVAASEGLAVEDPNVHP
jgi:uncharacterized protein